LIFRSCVDRESGQSGIMAEKLEPKEIEEKISALDGWKVNEEGKLEKEYKFGDFVEAFSFLAAVAVEAEKLNHHPEIYNVYSTVRIQLTTHDADGLTDLDFQLAAQLDQRA